MLFAVENLLVFAAIGGRQPLLEIAEKYKKEHNINIIYDFGGTGRLANKMFVGQKPDLFIAGSKQWADVLVEKKYCSDYFPIVWHTPVIIVKKNSPINSAKDLYNKKFRIALGDPQACAIGATTTQILANSKKTVRDVNLAAYGTTVKQLVYWVEAGVVDCSIVWHADAIESGRVKIVNIPDSLNAPSFIPVCQLNAAGQKSQAQNFIDFLLTTGKSVFASYGFSPWNGQL